MKAYTMEDIQDFERNERGSLICPSGDYTQIKSFGEFCSFSAYCSFSEDCRFGANCKFGANCNLDNGHRFEGLDEVVDRVIKIDCIGSRKGCTYFFKTISEIYVRCGCWFGTLNEFETAVNETHKDSEQYLKEYTEAIKYIRAVM